MRYQTVGHFCQALNTTNVVLRPSFPMMTITYSMMMMMSCLADPVGAEVANQSNSCLHHSSSLPHEYVGPAEVLVAGGWWLCEQRAFSELPRCCLFLLFLLRYESYCATGVDPGHRRPSW